jgi:CreA protein
MDDPPLTTIHPSILQANTAALAVLGIFLLMGGGSDAALAQERVGAVSTTFRLIGPNDKVVVDRYDDPKVENAACYVSRAETGGIGGAVGLSEDPSRFSIACRAVGPLKVVGKIDETEDGETVFSARTSAIFKSMQVTRFFDKTKNVLVYLVTSTKVVEGSPFNSISVVPLNR